MGDLLNSKVLGDVRAPGDLVVIPVRVAIDGSGAATLVDDRDGTITVTRSTNDYTLSVGRFTSLGSCVAVNGAGVAVDGVVATPASGTVEIQHAGGLTTTTIDVLLSVYRN